MITCRKKMVIHPDIDDLLKKMQLEKEKVNQLIAEALWITEKLHTDEKEKTCTG